MSGKRIIVCRCEDVTREDIEAALQDGLQGSAHLKHATRAAMGFCGGRTCRRLVERIAADVSGTEPRGEFTYQMPVRPVTTARLASADPHDAS